jgi:hypothetical protein
MQNNLCGLTYKVSGEQPKDSLDALPPLPIQRSAGRGYKWLFDRSLYPAIMPDIVVDGRSNSECDCILTLKCQHTSSRSGVALLPYGAGIYRI